MSQSTLLEKKCPQSLAIHTGRRKGQRCWADSPSPLPLPLPYQHGDDLFAIYGVAIAEKGRISRQWLSRERVKLRQRCAVRFCDLVQRLHRRPSMNCMCHENHKILAAGFGEIVQRISSAWWLSGAIPLSPAVGPECGFSALQWFIFFCRHDMHWHLKMRLRK